MSTPCSSRSRDTVSCNDLTPGRGKVNENILISADNIDENDFPSEDEVDLHPNENDFGVDDEIYDENGRELLASENNTARVEQVQSDQVGLNKQNRADLYRNLQDDPIFHQIVNKAVEEKLRHEREAIGPQGECMANEEQVINISNGEEIVHSIGRSGLHMPSQTQGTPAGKSGVRPKSEDLVKSPSDMTIYAPGLRCVNERSYVSNFSLNLRKEPNVHQISEFVDQMRIEADENKKVEEQRSLSQAKDIANKIIINAEKFRANVDNPTGKDNHDNLNHAEQVLNMNVPGGINPGMKEIIQGGQTMMQRSNDMMNKGLILPGGMAGGGTLPQNQVGSLDTLRISGDENFFHITCHIEPGLKEQIEKGEFVELEKLLPKDLTRRTTRDESRMELVHSNGATYFVPAMDKDRKISNVHRWEQAFWVYATIYTKANPHRAAEIWQYVYVINLAASSFSWENVANYDYTFR